MCSRRRNHGPLTQRAPSPVRIALQRQRVADDLVEALLEDLGQPRALLGVVELALERIDVGRQPPLVPQVVPGVLVAGHRVLGIDAEPLGQRGDEALRVARRRAVVARRRRRSAPGRARSARRPAASSSRAPSAAATRRDTTCPGRSAASPPGAKRSRSRRSSIAGAARACAARARRCSTRRRRVSSIDDERRLAAHRQPHVAGCAGRRRPRGRARRSPPTARRCTAW